MKQFEAVVALVPELARATDLLVSSLSDGLTNTSYLVTTGSSRVVVRISSEHRSLLGIDRTIETTALQLAQVAGIGPEVLLMTQPDGHLVTRYIPDADTLTVDQMVTPVMIGRIARTLSAVHSLGEVDRRFDARGDIERWMAVLETRGSRLPNRLGGLLARLMESGQSGRMLHSANLVLCHNDPYHLNFLDDGDDLWLVDWEYAGMGDPIYDLAGIGYLLDEAGRAHLLKSYFGSVEPWMGEHLEALILLYICWNVVWCLVEDAGGVEGFDYAGLAEEFLDRLPD